jgi:hypothetical protein
MRNSKICQSPSQTIAASLHHSVRFLVFLAALCCGASVVAQEIVAPPAPPGTANYIQWNGSAYRVSFGWDNPDGSITPFGGRSGGVEADDSAGRQARKMGLAPAVVAVV